MTEIPPISDRFLAAADIEAETPITIGVNMVGPDGRFTRPQPVMREEWDAWASNFPLKDMRRLKFSLPTSTSAADAILEFFGVSSPETWQAAWQATAVAYRQTRVFDTRKEAVAAWVREAELVARRVPVAEFNAASLWAALNELRWLTREKIDAALSHAQEICSRCGVALVLVPELPGTRISGCARWLTNEHAMIGLTLRYKTSDQLWYTFFHEVGHILLHHDYQSIVVDNAVSDMSDEMVDPEMAMYEEEADVFAADSLIPRAELAKLPLNKPDELTNEVILDFAESIGVHPGIVVGRLQHNKVLEHWQGNKLKLKLEWDFVTEE